MHTSVYFFHCCEDINENNDYDVLNDEYDENDHLPINKVIKVILTYIHKAHPSDYSL